MSTLAKASPPIPSVICLQFRPCIVCWNRNTWQIILQHKVLIFWIDRRQKTFSGNWCNTGISTQPVPSLQNNLRAFYVNWDNIRVWYATGRIIIEITMLAGNAEHKIIFQLKVNLAKGECAMASRSCAMVGLASAFFNFSVCFWVYLLSFCFISSW